MKQVKLNGYILVDYFSYGGGVNNYQRARVKVHGYLGGTFYTTTSKNDGVVEGRAKRWCKKHNILLSGNKS